MKRFITIISLFFLLTFISFRMSAQDNNHSLKVGDQITLFTALDDQGIPWRLADVLGEKIVVVYFYPAAMTGGCTMQACSYRDNLSSLEKYGVEVIGVSGDYPESLKYFRKAYNLNFTLLSDPEGKIANIFGVPLREGGEIIREVDGQQVKLKRGTTASRWTFIIGKDNKVLYVNQSVKADTDSEQVLEVVSKAADQ